MTERYPPTPAGATASLAAAGLTPPASPTAEQRVEWANRLRVERDRLRRLASYQAVR